jgi:putative heme iron utilization protein
MLATSALAGGHTVGTVCASPEQRARVTELYAANPVMAVIAAGQSGIPEAAAASALPADVATGVSAEHFEAVWASIGNWDTAVFEIMKAGQIYQVFGKALPGQWSDISKNYNLAAEPGGLSGHLRPDLMSAIYALEVPAKNGKLRGVMFLDAAGNHAFGVIAPPASAPGGAEVAAQFAATQALMKNLPRVCAD